MLLIRTEYDRDSGIGVEFTSKPEGMPEAEYWAAMSGQLSTAVAVECMTRANGSKGVAKLFAEKIAEAAKRIIEDGNILDDLPRRVIRQDER